MNAAQIEAITQANAFLQNAGLITYSDLIAALHIKGTDNLLMVDVAPEHDATIVALAQNGDKTSQALLHWS